MFIAERQGFEPRVPRGTTVFKTAAIDHSATSPKLLSKCFQDRRNRPLCHLSKTPFEVLYFSKAMQR